MKLCAIYNIWHDWDLLELSIKNIEDLVDGVIIIYSEKSNYGEVSEKHELEINSPCFLFNREPQLSTPMNSETDKRNYGLQKARELGFTHFLTCDSDEFYHADQFLQAKERFHVEPDLAGLVVPCDVLFKSPTLSIGRDITLVPFIHKLTPEIRHSFNRSYPFAWIDGKIRIDPTRSLNITSGVEYTEEVVMIHASWIRKDFGKKIRNSTARANIERSTIVQDLLLAKEGYFVNFYGKILHTVPNTFNLPE